MASAAAGLLALLGIDIDPVRSREFILVSSLLDHAWRAGRDVDIAGLIRDIQSPPFDKIGVMEVDTFYPPRERLELSMTLNSLLASPSFAGWLEGEPLDIKRLLYTPQGKPRISILSIAHLSDAERMFFVTILLNELLAWVRTQAGTSSLRALFYMDEVFGYFPPVANPPSKTPMLTLLKQARAFGLGLVLATQNPVDLDYKGLSNCGTWFLGRLQTERDKARVLDGLEGASAQAGLAVDRQQLDTLLSGLGSRVFLMNNVHEDEPVVFRTRWALSYLRGPLTRDQIRQLMEPRKAQSASTADEPARAVDATVAESPVVAEVIANTAPEPARQAIPAQVHQYFLPAQRPAPEGGQAVYLPALYGVGHLHFVRVGYGVDHWEDRALLQDLRRLTTSSPWDGAHQLDQPLTLLDAPESPFAAGPVDERLTDADSYPSWQKKLIDALYQSHRLTIYHCASLKAYSHPGEGEDDFRIRLTHQLHELRDEQVQQLREKFAARMAKLDDQIRSAQDRLREAESEYRHETLDTAISIGTSIFGALFSRKKLSKTNVDRASSSARKAGRVAREKADVRRVKDQLDQLIQKRGQLDEEIADQVARIEAQCQPDRLRVKRLELKPLKKDVSDERVAVVWIPWHLDPQGQATRAC